MALHLPLRFDWMTVTIAFWFVVAAQSIFVAALLCNIGWIARFIALARAYTHYTFGRSLLDVWFTPRAGWVVAAGLLLAVFAYCWQYRLHPPDSPGFFLVTSLILASTLVVIPTLAPHPQLLLLPFPVPVSLRRQPAIPPVTASSAPCSVASPGVAMGRRSCFGADSYLGSGQRLTGMVGASVVYEPAIAAGGAFGIALPYSSPNLAADQDPQDNRVSASWGLACLGLISSSAGRAKGVTTVQLSGHVGYFRGYYGLYFGKSSVRTSEK